MTASPPPFPWTTTEMHSIEWGIERVAELLPLLKENDWRALTYPDLTMQQDHIFLTDMWREFKSSDKLQWLRSLPQWKRRNVIEAAITYYYDGR